MAGERGAEGGGRSAPQCSAPGRSDWLLAIGHVIVVDAPIHRRVLAIAEAGNDDTRFNDCKCDPHGRLWAGTMSKTRTKGAGALHRVEPDGAIEQMLDGTSSGIGWSPAGDIMYFVDSTTQRLDAFDFDVQRGTISAQRAIAEVDPDDGLADG